MKKKISLLLAILMLVTLIPTSFAERQMLDAKKNNQRIALDGVEVKVGSYLVEDYNYIKLRDVAALLTETANQFEVGVAEENPKLIVLALGKEHRKRNNDLEEIKKERAKASVGTIQVRVKGEIKELKTALIDGFNYVQLRDLAKFVGFTAGYDAKNKTILINTEKKDENYADLSENGVPESEWTEGEKAWFKDRKTYLSNMVLVTFGFATADGNADIERIKEKYLNNAALSIMGGRKLFDGEIKSQINKVEIRDGVRYAIATLVYPSEATVVFEGQNIGKDNAFWKSNFYNLVILNYSGALSDQYKNDKKAVCDQLIKFHDAIANKDYEKAVKEIKELNINATVESVKLFEERMKEHPGKSDIFKKDYTTEFTEEKEDSNVYVTFKYTDGDVFRIMYMHSANTGIVGYGYKAN